MLEFLLSSLIFAQGPNVPAPNQGLNPMIQFLFMGVAIMAMFYIMLVRPNQKREQERKSMLASLKKNDHVVTVGGVKGIVANVKLEDDEIVLKIDEDSGAKMRVVLSSIARVIASDKDAAAAKKES